MVECLFTNYVFSATNIYKFFKDFTDKNFILVTKNDAEKPLIWGSKLCAPKINKTIFQISLE